MLPMVITNRITVRGRRMIATNCIIIPWGNLALEELFGFMQQSFFGDCPHGLGDPTQRDSPHHCLGAAACLKLAKDMRQMTLDGAVADPQLCPDSFIGKSLRHQYKDFHFTVGKCFHWGRFLWVAE